MIPAANINCTLVNCYEPRPKQVSMMCYIFSNPEFTEKFKVGVEDIRKKNEAGPHSMKQLLICP